MSIRYKLLLGFGVLLIVYVAAIFMISNRLFQLQADYSWLITETFPSIDSLEHIKSSNQRIATSIYEIGLLQATIEEEEHLFRIDEEQEIIANEKLLLSVELQNYLVLVRNHNQEDQDFALAVQQRVGELNKKSDNLVALINSQASLSKLHAGIEEFHHVVQDFHEIVNNAIERGHREIQEKGKEVTNDIKGTIYNTGIASIILLISIIGISHRLSYIIVNPLIKLRDKVTQISKGEFDVLEETASRDEIGDLVNSFSKMTHDLKEAQKELIKKERLAALGQLTATISHEIRNPLGTIKNCLSFLQKYMQDDQPLVKDSVENAVVNVRRCNDIITDLLIFTREQPLNPEPTDVDDWLNKLLDEYKLDPEIKLNRQLEGGVEIDINRERLRRVLINVLDNACQAMTTQEGDVVGEKDKRLTVATQTVDGRLELSIHDTGQGIAPNELEKIFELFYSTKNFGVGLGLPTVKKIMEEHSGGIEITSEINQGTHVILWLPLPAVN